MNVDDLFDGYYENFVIVDFFGVCSFDDCFDGGIDMFVVNDNFDFDFG